MRDWDDCLAVLDWLNWRLRSFAQPWYTWAIRHSWEKVWVWAKRLGYERQQHGLGDDT